MTKTAIVTGVSGQDGAYLTQRLLGRGYTVIGVNTPNKAPNIWRLDELGILNHPTLSLQTLDLLNSEACHHFIEAHQPDEIYNLAAQTFVGVSFDNPLLTVGITAMAPVYLLEAIRSVKPNIRFFQASSAEMFGKAITSPQTEESPFHPRSNYGIAKMFAHSMSVYYRETYGIFASCGILYNHESSLRGLDFVTRKITDSLVKIKLGLMDVLELGNLNAKRDWGDAEEYVTGMWQMLQVDEPDTYILATNRVETVREFINIAARSLDMQIEWKGDKQEEQGIDAATGKTIVRVNPKFYRPDEPELLQGDYAKAKRILGWEPKTRLETLCQRMMSADLKRNQA